MTTSRTEALAEYHLVLGENPQPCPQIRMARWPKTPGELEGERAHDKTGERVVCMVCSAGVDNVKSEKIIKGDKMKKVR